MRATILTVLALVWAAGAAAQIPMPGRDPSLDQPMTGVPFTMGQPQSPTDTYRRPRIRETMTDIQIEVPTDSLFDFDRSSVRPDAWELLGEMANTIQDRSKGIVRIECHTDRGPPADTQKRAERCAAAIQQWLIQRERLTNVKFATVGFGTPAPGPAAANPPFNDPDAVTRRRNSVQIVFAKK
jgi:outer membrane protein OmpA-like peptidoglycan-associated protein